MAPYLPPIEHPQGLLMKFVYRASRRQMGKVPTPIKVVSARMPASFMSFFGKVSKLDKKLVLPKPTVIVIREQVAHLNSCLFCMDVGRWAALQESPDDVVRIDALTEYRTSPLFSEAERAALDYVTELTTNKHAEPTTFARVAEFYSEREICEIAWLVASEHLYNMSNHALNIGSDELCPLRPAAQVAS